MMLACGFNRVPVIAALIAACSTATERKRVVNSPDVQVGRQPLSPVAMYRHWLTNTNAQTGLTPLMVAAERGFYEAAKVLLEAGATIDAVNRYGSSALMLACQEQRPRLVKLLMAYKANIGLQDSKGATALSESTHGV